MLLYRRTGAGVEVDVRACSLPVACLVFMARPFMAVPIRWSHLNIVKVPRHELCVGRVLQVV